jgi:hypothetical protein
MRGISAGGPVVLLEDSQSPKRSPALLAMSSPIPPDSQQLPESLRIQLAQFRGHLWRIKVIEAVAAGFIGLLISFLLVYGLDRIWPTPGWARLILLVAGVSVFAGFAPYWLHKWVWRQRREAQLARLIARKFPGLGDRLLGVIELEHQEGSPDSLSPRLRQAAMIAVAAETGRRTLDDALPEPKHRRWALAACALAGIAALALTLTPRAGINALQRWLMPLSETERYTFTRLEDAPTRLQVPFGESFEIVLQLAADTEQRPDRAAGRYALQPVVETKRDGDTYHFRFPGQQDPGTIDFRIGDLRHAVAVEPVLRPAIQSVHAHVTPPEYLGFPTDPLDVNNGVVSIVQGGHFHVEMKTSRPLREGSYGPARALSSEEQPSAEEWEDISGSLLVDGSVARTPQIVPKTSFELPFTWTDQIGLSGDTGFRLQIDVRPDAAPTCYLQGVDRQKAMLPEETLDMEILAEDDLGIRASGLEWRGEFTRATDETPAKGEFPLSAGSGAERRLLLPVAFSPSAFGITPQKLILRGYTEDALPGRGRVYSEPIEIYVLTRDEHAQLLKGRFDRQITELEDLARRELELLEENERIERLTGEELQQDENRKRMQNQESEEAETARRTEELKSQMEKLLQDAARNGDIEKKTLQKMAESLKSIQELAEKDVPEVQEKLKDAQESSNTPEQSKKEMSEATKEQREVVEKMKEAVAKANDANRDFEAGTFVNRLKKAAQEQEGIVSTLKSAFERLLGERQPSLDPSDIRRLDETTRQQSETASDVRWIQEDLASFFARMQDEDFRLLMEEMREAKIDMGLDEIRMLLATNHSFRAAEKSKYWATKLQEWADKLAKKNEEGGGGGGAGGAPSSEDEDFEFMLRVMRMIQQEQDLRGRTRVLEQLRRDNNAAP